MPGLRGHALATGYRAASGPTARFPRGWTQSAIFDGCVLSRTCWVACISLLWRNDVLTAPAEFHAVVGPAAGQIVSSIQLPIAGELVGDHGAVVVLPILRRSIARRLRPVTRH